MVYIAKNPEEENIDARRSRATDDEKILNQISSKSAFVVGLIGSILGLCTIGFITMLVFCF